MEGTEEKSSVEAAKNHQDENLFNLLLNIVSKLTELSYFNVYSDSFEKIKKSYGTANLIKWKYRTFPKDRNSSEIKEYGEFNTEEIKSWISQVNLYFLLSRIY